MKGGANEGLQCHRQLRDISTVLGFNLVTIAFQGAGAVLQQIVRRTLVGGRDPLWEIARMNWHRWLVGFVLASACGLGGGEAKAHFLFIRIGPEAEAGRSAEVYFSEQAEAGDPRFVPKVAHTQLWAQAAPGSFRALTVRKGADRLTAPAARRGERGGRRALRLRGAGAARTRRPSCSAIIPRRSRGARRT